MLSRKNTKLMVEKQANKQARYGLRKLNIGVASILLGLSFLGAGSISADELNNTTEANVENVAPTEDKSINEHKIRECKNVKRTINFYQDGKLIDSITQSADFYRYNIWNLETNELITSTPWLDTTTHRTEHYFAAVDVPEIAGYTADQTKIENTTVTGDSADQVINVNYTATTEEQTEQKTVKRVIRLAKDGVVFKEIPQEFTFTRTNIVDKQTGQIVQTGTWNQAEHTFAAVDIEQLENYTASQNRVEALTVDPESPDSVVDINYTAAQKVEDEFKTVERLIEIYHEGVKVDVFTQKVEFKRTKTTNLATNEVTYGAWDQAEGLWIAFDAPVYDNYETDTIKVDNKTVTPDTANEIARIDYTAKRENLTEEKVVKRVINIYKDGQKVDQHVQSVTFKRTNIKNLATGEITYGEWDEPSKMLDDYRGPEFENYDSPSNRYVPRTAVSAATEDLEVNMHYTAKVATSIEQKIVMRRILMHFPDGTTKKVTQQVAFKREVKTNLATGEKEYGAWSMEKNTLPAYKVDQVENYEPSQSVVEAVVVTPETETWTVDIYYNAKTVTEVEEKVALRQILLHLPDGTVKEVTQQVTFKREVKTNLATGEKEYGAWDIEEGTLPEYQVEQVENYEPSHSVVEAMVVTPETSGSWTVDIYYNAKTATEVEEKVALRQILLHLPDGTVKEVTQQVTFKREIKTNLATGEKEYGAWDIEEGTLPEYQVEQVENYEPSHSVVEAMVVTPETSGNWTVDIYYNAKTATEVEEKVALRQILLHLPDGTVKEVTQQVTFKREVKTNLATGEKEYGAWDIEEGTLPEYQVEQVENYEPSHSVVEAMVVTPETASNWTVDIYYNAKTATEVEEKVALRQILLHLPDGTVKEVTQQVTFKREVKTNLATGEKEYGAWDIEEGTLPEYQVEQVENYEPSHSVVEAMVVTPETAGNWTVDIYYNAKTATEVEEKVALRQILLHLPDGTVKEVTQQVTFKREVKTNLATGEKEYGAWDIEEGTLPEYQVEQVENYEPSHSVVEAMVVTPETAGNWTVDIYYNAKTATEVEEKVALRQILLHLPDGTVKEVTQQVTFKREVKTNLATGEKEYGAWDIEEGTLPEYQVEQVENYEPSQSVVEAMVVTPETSGSWTVDIYYNAKTATEVEEKVALRQILLHLPDGTVKEVTQQITFKREVKTNLATGEKEYGAWDIEEGTLPEYQVEQVENYEPSHSVVEAMVVTPETAGNWTVDIYYNAKTTTRTEYYTAKRVISLVKDGKKVDEITQSVLFKREVTKNLATGEETFGDWSTDNDSWETFVAPSFENYIADIPQLEAVKVDTNTKDTEVTINYTAATKEVQETRTVKRVINIYRDGKKVDEITQRVVFTRTNIVNLATGEITYGAWDEDQKYFAEYEVPEVYGYEPEEKIISAMAVDPEMQDATANVNYKSIVTTEVEEKVVDRKIILNLPNGMTREHIQSVTFKREVYKNLATGEMTYGAWDIPQATFEAYQVPGFSGYVASVKHIEALEVTADSESTTVVVDYYQQSKDKRDVFRIFNIQVIDGVLPRGKQQYTQKVTFTRDIYLDANGKVVGHGDWEQTELMFEDFEIPQREGYATFRSVIAGQKVTVDSENLESEITYVAHASDTETKEVKRKVTIIWPDGSTHEEIQTVTFVRDKVTNQISGKTSYGSWLPATENSEFPEMVLPDIAGYKPSQTVDRLDVTSDMANSEVTVTYERDGDAGETTPDAPGNGEVTPDVPGNGETTPDTPDAGETTPDVPGNGDATPDVPGNGETTPDAPGNGETTPDAPGNGEATPDAPDAGETTPDTPDNGETTPDTPNAGETTPDTPGNGETTPDTPDAGETTPDTPGNGEATPDTPDAGETTPDVPGDGETTPDAPDAGETTPDIPGNGEATPDTPGAGETTPDAPENGETTSGAPEAGDDSDSDDTDQGDLGMKPEIGNGQPSPSKMKNNGSSAKVSNMANSSVDKVTKNNAVAGTELPSLGDETVGLKGLGALLAAMACAPLFMSATAKKRKN